MLNFIIPESSRVAQLITQKNSTDLQKTAYLAFLVLSTWRQDELGRKTVSEGGTNAWLGVWSPGRERYWRPL